MRLSADEVARFYRIWFPLLHFVNEWKRLLPSFPAAPGDAEVNPTDAVKVRDALWADDALREAFIEENPAQLSEADLALVKSWQHRVAGNFYIERYLKKYAVFLSDRAPRHAYGVLGLASAVEEIISPYLLPAYVQAVLLPFEDRIIFDSLLSSYPLLIGPGITRDLRETYRMVKEREGIITTLPRGAGATPEEVRREVTARNRKILNEYGKYMVQGNLSLKTLQQHVATIEAFAGYLLAQDPARGLLDMTEDDVRAYLTGAGKGANLVSFKRFVRFLLDTGRMEYDRAEDLNDWLRSARK